MARPGRPPRGDVRGAAADDPGRRRHAPQEGRADDGIVHLEDRRLPHLGEVLVRVVALTERLARRVLVRVVEVHERRDGADVARRIPGPNARAVVEAQGPRRAPARADAPRGAGGERCDLEALGARGGPYEGHAEGRSGQAQRDARCRAPLAPRRAGRRRHPDARECSLLHAGYM